MTTHYGPIRQVGHVVRDAEDAMKYWIEVMGVGPFFVAQKVLFTDYRYRGQATPAPVVTLCFAQAGDVQIELIQQHNNAPSAYREFLSAGRTGVQHLSTWFDDAGEYDTGRQRAIANGLTLVHESIGGPGRFCYFETGNPEVPLIELSEALNAFNRAFTEGVAAASIGWDGSDPIRYIS